MSASTAAPDHLVLNRFNRGLWDLADRVSRRGENVSLRPRQLGHHDRLEDYLSLLPLTDQLVVSSRHGVMRHLAKLAGCVTGRGRPDALETLEGPTVGCLASWLLARMPSSATVALTRYPAGDTVFCRAGHAQIRIPAPEGYRKASRAARLQGALMAAALRPDNPYPREARAENWQT